MPVLIEKDKDGFFASCPLLQGCFTEGDTLEEVFANITEAVRAHIEVRLEKGEPISTAEVVHFATIEVHV